MATALYNSHCALLSMLLSIVVYLHNFMTYRKHVASPARLYVKALTSKQHVMDTVPPAGTFSDLIPEEDFATQVCKGCTAQLEEYLFSWTITDATGKQADRRTDR